jgi:hypothetical protein
MEDIKEEALKRATNKPFCWFRHANASILWPNRCEKLDDFLYHLNRIHNNIQFTTEANNCIPFLDIFTGDLMVPWDTQYTESPLTPTCI